MRIPPPLVYAGVFGVGLLLQRLFPLPILSDRISQWPALICAGAAAILGVWSLVRFGRARTSVLPFRPSTALVTSGPYRYTRNPMYVSLFLLYTGCAFWFNIVWPLVLSPVLIAIVRYSVIEKEERYLEQIFGQEYIHYEQRVRRWI